MKKMVVNNSGTSSLTSDFTNLRLYDDVGTTAGGSFIMAPGYNANVIALTVVANAAPNYGRILGTMDKFGSTTTNLYSVFPGNNFRSIVSNGHFYWICGTVTGGAGLYYLKDLSSTPVSLGSINTRVVKLINNKLFYSTATTGGTGVFQVSANGLPVQISDVSLSRLTNATYASSAKAGSPYAFDINPAENVMYIADDAAYISGATQKGGIIKYTKSGFQWSFAYTLPSPSASARGLVVDWTTPNPSAVTPRFKCCNRWKCYRRYDGIGVFFKCYLS